MNPHTVAGIIALIDGGSEHDWASETLLKAAVERGEIGAKFALSLWREKQIGRLRSYLDDRLWDRGEEYKPEEITKW